jgi:hypothetical protein
MNPTAMPKTDNSARSRRNWLVLVILLAVAAALYGLIMVKIKQYGYPSAP